ncbi:MAG: hypothetical protein AVDCRST_MAG26-4021 [uncultured Chloroflexia bacterium]|uniref:Uncharacterized protein n=1 Tax=uncultured Chloroflexia bacterium TaxID=1672391 RepID=A0A6J4JXN5_9CHLR|nr:MAG: hypothetical protein AVDCRST_MAG26-4021 [uncultured Chloroflexia bacterium]
MLSANRRLSRRVATTIKQAVPVSVEQDEEPRRAKHDDRHSSERREEQGCGGFSRGT